MSTIIIGKIVYTKPAVTALIKKLPYTPNNQYRYIINATYQNNIIISKIDLLSYNNAIYRAIILDPKFVIIQIAANPLQKKGEPGKSLQNPIRQQIVIMFEKPATAVVFIN